MHIPMQVLFCLPVGSGIAFAGCNAAEENELENGCPISVALVVGLGCAVEAH